MVRGAIILLWLAAATSPSVAQLRGPALNLGIQVYLALSEGKSRPSTTGALLRDSINGQQGLCLNVAAFQLYRQAPGAVTAKVDCGAQGIYLLSVDAAGMMRASGGDGSVAALKPVDGVIVRTTTEVVDEEADPLQRLEERAANIPARMETPQLTQLPPEDHSDVYNWAALGFGLGFLAIGLMVAHTAISRRTVGGAGRVLPLSSADKDRLIAEAIEVRDDMYRHPTGVLIVRGRHGKRRLFPNRLYAEIYWRFGLKIAQIR